MGLGSRGARLHQTVASLAATGIAEDIPEGTFVVGQRVRTADGFPGVVQEVSEGRRLGYVAYKVTLDDGLGGGHYDGTQLSPENEKLGTAVESYPEIGRLLVERPDPAKITTYASKTASEDYLPDGVEQCPECGEHVNTNHGEDMWSHMSDEHGKDLDEHYERGNPAWMHSWNPREGASRNEPGVDDHGHLSWGGDAPGCGDADDDQYSMMGQNDAVQHTASTPVAEAPPEAEKTNPCFAHPGWRHPAGENCACFHGGPAPMPPLTPRYKFSARTSTDVNHQPGRLAIEPCPNCGGPKAHVDDYTCPDCAQRDAPWGDEVGALGDFDSPYARGPVDRVNQHVSASAADGGWAAEYTPEELAGACHMHHARPEDANSHALGDHFAWNERNDLDAWGLPKHQSYDGHDAWSCNNRDCSEHPQSMYEQSGTQSLPGWQAYDAHPDADLRRQVNQAMSPKDTEDANWLLDQQHQGPSKYSVLSKVAADSDFRFEFTAAWSDVRRKAKRIRAEGGVHVTLATSGAVFAEVKGDHNVYETAIQRLPGRHAVQNYSCGCAWGAYHWGADDDMSRFAGRMCSHALALQYEAQSRGMFGRDVYQDTHTPEWVPRTVVVKYDIDGKSNIAAPASHVAAYQPTVPAHSPLVHLARLARLAGESDAEVGLALQVAQLPALAVTAAVNDAWGEPVPEPPHYTPGPTSPKDPNANPASAGFADAPDPDNWSQQGPGGIGVYAAWNPLDYGATADDQGSGDDSGDDQQGGSSHSVLPRVPRPGAGAGVADAAAGAGEAAAAGAGEAAAAGAAGGLADLAPLLLLASREAIADDDLWLFDASLTGPEATLHEGPEGALPFTDGDLGDGEDLSPEDSSIQTVGGLGGSEQDIIAQFQATAAAQVLGSGRVAPGGDNAQIAAMARETLAKESMKSFTSSEQAQLINEGRDGVRARNTDRMDIAGTHYAELEKVMAAADGEDDDRYWLG